MHINGFFFGLTLFKGVARTFFIAICSISLTSCMVYVSSEEPEVVAATITAGSNDKKICQEAATLRGEEKLIWRQKKRIWINEVQKRGLDCAKILAQRPSFSTGPAFTKVRSLDTEKIANSTDGFVCASATKTSSGTADKNLWNSNNTDWVDEAKRRGLNCDVVEAADTQITSPSTVQSTTPSSAELIAAEKEAERLNRSIKASKARQEQLSMPVGNRTQLSTLPDCM